LEASRYSLIAREGWMIILLACLPALISLYQGWYLAAILCLIPVPLILWFFRDPTRVVPASPLGVVSPADGRIVEINNNEHDPFLDRPCIRITINMSWHGVFGIRNPMEGKIQRQWFAPPDQAPAWMRASRVFSHWVQSDELDDVVVCKEPKWWPWQRVFYQQIGERVGQGQRSGYMYFGARVHLLLPVKVNLHCKVGDRVLAGSDVLAQLVH